MGKNQMVIVILCVAAAAADCTCAGAAGGAERRDKGRGRGGAIDGHVVAGQRGRGWVRLVYMPKYESERKRERKIERNR
jgi:hypothetical protein